MRKTRPALFFVLSATFLYACAPSPAPRSSSAAASEARPLSPAVAPDIAKRLPQLPGTVIDYDRSLLDENERQVVAKLIEASRLIDEIFLRQVSEENPGTRRELEVLAPRSASHRDALAWFDIMKGRWDRLKHDEPFVAPFGQAGARPQGAGFYPEDMTKAEFEKWIADHPGDREDFQSLTTVIRRQQGELVALPYSAFYAELLVRAAIRLEEAAKLTKDPLLRDFLVKRAKAFLTDDYFESDVAWMDLKGPIDITIGPYEVYEDGLFNYKAAFESFVTVVDKAESAKLALYTRALPDMERNLPIPDEHKNFTRGTDSPIRVVQEIYSAGDGRHGVQTAAFNLPNDEKVRQAKGAKLILLKNVMDAKFRLSGRPIADRVLDPAQLPLVSFEAYFATTLFHELSHGLGPGIITGPDGKKVETRLLLKDQYSALEECKADVLGVWNILFALDRKLLTGIDEKGLYATNAALMFRGMRFGLSEAHGRGTAVQWNWYREKGGIVPARDGRFRMEPAAFREGAKSLAHELLMIQATGDYQRGKRLLDTYGVSTPEIAAVLPRLADIPVDIAPVFAAAGEK
jgi:hypothetical protein